MHLFGARCRLPSVKRILRNAIVRYGYRAMSFALNLWDKVKPC